MSSSNFSFSQESFASSSVDVNVEVDSAAEHSCSVVSSVHITTSGGGGGGVDASFMVESVPVRPSMPSRLEKDKRTKKEKEPIKIPSLPKGKVHEPKNKKIVEAFNDANDRLEDLNVIIQNQQNWVTGFYN